MSQGLMMFLNRKGFDVKLEMVSLSVAQSGLPVLQWWFVCHIVFLPDNVCTDQSFDGNNFSFNFFRWRSNPLCVHVNERIVLSACALYDCDEIEKKHDACLRRASEQLKDVSGINTQGWSLLKLSTALMLICFSEEEILVGEPEEVNRNICKSFAPRYICWKLVVRVVTRGECVPFSYLQLRSCLSSRMMHTNTMTRSIHRKIHIEGERTTSFCRELGKQLGTGQTCCQFQQYSCLHTLEQTATWVLIC